MIVEHVITPVISRELQEGPIAKVCSKFQPDPGPSTALVAAAGSAGSWPVRQSATSTICSTGVGHPTRACPARRAVSGALEEHAKFDVGVRGADVRDGLVPTSVLGHDLDRDRVGCGTHFPYECHPPEPARLVLRSASELAADFCLVTHEHA